MNYLIRLHTACGCEKDLGQCFRGTPPREWHVAISRLPRFSWEEEPDEALTYTPLKRTFDLYDLSDMYGYGIAHYRERL